MAHVTGSDGGWGPLDLWTAAAALLAPASAPRGRDEAWAQASALLEEGDRDGIHLVASAFVVDVKGLVLLARHRRYGQWGPVGGHVEASDADLRAAASREISEETGLAATVGPVPLDVILSSYRCRTMAQPMCHLDVLFVALTTESSPHLVVTDELTEHVWCGTEDLPPLDPAARELVRRAVEVAASLRG